MIFKALNKKFIKKLFEEKKKLFFSSAKGEISEIKIEKLSPDWAKESCLARYEIFFGDETKKIIRGTARSKKSKKPAWQVMKYLYSHNFSNGPLQIARPFDYIASVNLLLYQELPGFSLTQVIEREKDIVVEQNLKGAANWLAKLHRLEVSQNFPKAVFIDFESYKGIFKTIEKYLPELKNNLIPIAKIKFINQIYKNRKNLIHNDFYPGNCIYNKKTFFAIDFDLAGLGPRLADVAAFSTALDFPKEVWNLKRPEQEIRRFQDIFLRQYCRQSRLDYSKIKKDLKKFIIKIFLDQIYYYAAFTIRGRNFMDKKTKENFILKIRALLLKTKQHLGNL